VKYIQGNQLTKIRNQSLKLIRKSH